MRRIALTVALVALNMPLAAQDMPPRALEAYSVGVAESMMSQARPCFPNDRRTATELLRLRDEARARIAEQPELEAAFQTGQMRTNTQQRYFAPSDPVACRQALDALRYFLRNREHSGSRRFRTEG